MHTRQKIRNKIKQLLDAHPGLTACYSGTIQPAQPVALPFASVETGSETSVRLSDQFCELRTVKVDVRLYASPAEHAGDTLDALSETVESLLSLDQNLGGIAESFKYMGAESGSASVADTAAASLTMTFECKYVWAPQPPQDDFGMVAVEIDMANPRNAPSLPATPDGQIDAAVTIILPT